MLDLLKAAVAARIASWDADRALEEALGFPDGDVPDNVDSAIWREVGWLAGNLPADSVDNIAQEHVDSLLQAVKDAS